jgi:hypothetical protein
MSKLNFDLIDKTITNEGNCNISILFVKHGVYSSLETIPIDTTKTIIVTPGNRVNLPKELFAEHSAFVKRGNELIPLPNP